MEWLGSNWIWLALAAGFVAFFAFGRGGCGMGHGGHQDHRPQGSQDNTASTGQSALAGEHAGHGTGSAQPGGQRHRHGCC